MIGGKLILTCSATLIIWNMLPVRACRFFGYCTLIITIIGLLSTGIAQVIACRWMVRCILFGFGCPLATHFHWFFRLFVPEPENPRASKL